ncbi:MAG: ribonuclease H-like domain-containing protein [Chloroflexota bacterium]
MERTFPKHFYHSIACIGALVAHRDQGNWLVDAIGAPHIGERSEKELIEAFVSRIAELNPRLVTFNGNSFDLSVLRYRAMIKCVAAPCLSARPYFNRYTDDAIDLCDVLSSFSQTRAGLDELCKVMGLCGKPKGIRGSAVARFVREGKIKEVANYCETDIVNTYRLWLRYELFVGRLNANEYQASENNLQEFITVRINAKPHLLDQIRIKSTN